MRLDVLRLTLAITVPLYYAAPSMSQAPPAKGQAELAREIEELKGENETLRNLLPTSTSNSKIALANLSREVAALKERLQALEQERIASGRESDRLRTERERLRGDIARLYSTYDALRNTLIAMRSKLATLPVEIDVTKLRAQLSATLDAADLKAHLLIDNNQNIHSDPLTLRLEGTLAAAERIVSEAEKLLPEDYSFRVINPDKKDWAELFSTKVIEIQIVKGKQSGKDWQNLKLWGEHTPTLPPVEGLEIERKEESGNKWNYRWEIFPRKVGSYTLNFGIAGSADEAIKHSLEVKKGGWRLPFRFLWWLLTNYLFWLGGILMVLIGHADKILSFLKNWRAARRTGNVSASTAQEI